MNPIKEIVRKICFFALTNDHLMDSLHNIVVKANNVRESKNRIDFDRDYYNNYLSDEQMTELKDCISISFVGELILLRYQVAAAWNGSGYDFSDLFKYTKKIFSECDYSIGVLEGPVTSDNSYSNGDFLDGSNLVLNYPKEFITEIKNSGINLVSLANNHMYDKGAVGAYETVDNLKKLGLDYIGLNKERSESDCVKIINVKGLKIALLAYMDGQNKVSQDYFLTGENSYESSIIVSKRHPLFNAVKDRVKSDFDNAKKENPDLIIVIPHMGELGKLHTCDMQETWNQIFVEFGADVILTASSHSVQPVEWMKQKDKMCLVINSPGNYVNSRTSDDDDDASSIVKVYINMKDKNVKACSIIPLYARAEMDKLFIPMPISDIYNDLNVRGSLSAYDYRRVQNVQKIITRTMLGITFPIESAFDEYYMWHDKSVLFDREAALSKIDIDLNECIDYSINNFFKSFNKVLFIGDSISHGTKNGGFGWYVPLVQTYGFTARFFGGGGVHN